MNVCRLNILSRPKYNSISTNCGMILADQLKNNVYEPLHIYNQLHVIINN